MKLISLNTWGGLVGQPFIDFITKSKDVDIFCFQEVYDKAFELLGEPYPNAHHDLLTELRELLPNHNSFFRPAVEDVYGVATFVKKDIKLLEEGEIVIHRNLNKSLSEIDGHHDRNLQWIKIEHNGKNLCIANVHGLWNGRGKEDSPERLEQSRRIKEFMDGVEGDKILCGDFNLLPDTESIKIIESTGMKNLIKEHDIKSTRTSLYTKPLKFADYLFVSEGIQIKDFKVLPDEVSDHSPLYLEIK